MEKPNSLSRISYVILPSEPSVVTAKEEEISVVSVAAVFKSPPTPESVSSAVVPSQVSEVDILVVPLEERIEEFSVEHSPNQVSEISYNSEPLEVSEVSTYGGLQIPNEISEINILTAPFRPEEFSTEITLVWDLRSVSVRVFYEAPPEVDTVSTSILTVPNEPDLVSTELKMEPPSEVLIEYSPNSVLEGSIIIGSAPDEVQSVESISSDISEVDEVSVSSTPASASVISVSYTTNDTSVPVVEYSCNSVATVDTGRSPAIPSEVSSGYIPYDVDSVISEANPSTALDIHPGYITYSYTDAVLHEIDNDLVTLASNPLKDRTTGRPALTAENTYGLLRIYVDSEGDAYVLGKMNWGTDYTSWTKILDGVKSVWRVSRYTSKDSYLFLKENSELWAWGVGTSGILLTSDQSTYTTPIKVQENIKDVYFSGNETTLALKNDGTLIGAGDNFGGVLDTGTRGWQYTVVQVTTNVNQIYLPDRSHIYILKNDNYIYVNGGVKGPQNGDYTQLHQWRGNIAEIFPDTDSFYHPTYTYLNSSTHYRFTDYTYISYFDSWEWQENSTGYSNVRHIELSVNQSKKAIHTDQGIHFLGGDTIPYTGGTHGDVKYMILGANTGSNNIIVRTDNTYVEVDDLLVKTADSDNYTLLETPTLHTFPKYPIEVSNETAPFPVSVISTSTGPYDVESVKALSSSIQEVDTVEAKIATPPNEVDTVELGSSPARVQEVASLNLDLDSDDDGVPDIDDYFYYDPWETYTKAELETFTFDSTSAIADWDRIKFISNGGNPELHPGMIPGEFYLIGESEEFGWRVTDRDGDVYDSSGNVLRVYSADRGVLWEKLSNFQVTPVSYKLIGSAGENNGRHLSFNADGSVLAVNSDTSVRVYQVNGNELNQLGQDISISSTSFSSSALTDDGMTLAVGDPMVNQVRVYRFNGSTWDSPEILPTPANSSLIERFGWDVDISSNGEVLIASDPWRDYGSENYFGSVYVYHFNGASWELTSSVEPTDVGSAYFGRSISMDANGSNFVVGAPNYGEVIGINSSGQVRHYSIDSSGNAILENTIYSVQGQVSGDQFGLRVSMSSDGLTFASGSEWTDVNSTGDGCVEVFENISGNWTLKGQIITSPVIRDAFGVDVALSGDGTKFIAGANGHDIEVEGSAIYGVGKAEVYTYESGQWILTEQIVGTESTENMGEHVAISRDGSIGAVSSPTYGSDEGAVNLVPIG